MVSIKYLYGLQAILFTGMGLFLLYTASLDTDDYLLLGIGESVWFGGPSLIFGLLLWFLLLVKPNHLS